MRTRRDLTRLAVAALLALVAPLMVSQWADASDNVDQQSGTIQFFDFSDNVVMCTVINDSEHNTDNAAHPTVGIAWGGTPGNDCVGNSLFTITATWKDRNGVTRSFSESTFSPGNLTLDGATSAVHTSVSVHFFTCDPDFTISCDLAVPAAPK